MRNCSCVWIESDHENWCVRISSPVARKVHICCECGKGILPGQQYQYEVMKYFDEDGLATWKTCSDCKSMRDAFFCDGWWYGHIWKILSEHLLSLKGKVLESCIISLPNGAKTKVLDMIEQVWNELEEGEK